MTAVSRILSLLVIGIKLEFNLVMIFGKWVFVRIGENCVLKLRKFKFYAELKIEDIYGENYWGFMFTIEN